MILPDTIAYQEDSKKLRNYILSKTKMHKFINMGGVFERVTRPACILIIEQGTSFGNNVDMKDISSFSLEEKEQLLYSYPHESVTQDSMTLANGLLFSTPKAEHQDILKKFTTSAFCKLADLIDEDGIQRGVSPDLKKAFIVDHDTVYKYHLERNILKPTVTGGIHVKRFYIDYPKLFIIYTRNIDKFGEYPNACAYISSFRNEITCKEVVEGKHSIYALHRPRNEKIFLKQCKILGVITADRIIVAVDRFKTYATDGLYLFGVSDERYVSYLLGLLNSKLFIFLYRNLALEKGRVLAQVKPKILQEIPIRVISFDDNTDVIKYNSLVGLVEEVVELRKKYIALSQRERELVKMQIERKEAEIDSIVYEIYGLSQEEILLIERTLQ